MTLQREIDMIEPMDKHEPIDNSEPADAMEPTERIEPTEPTDSTEPFDAIDNTESSDQMDHLELSRARLIRLDATALLRGGGTPSVGALPAQSGASYR
jgi:hypothetical protein